MTKSELRDRIKALAPAAYASVAKSEQSAVEYEELAEFPQLKAVIVDLLTSDYGKFIDSIDWVAPKPTTFRINLLNGQSFYLIYHLKSWIAEISGKKYYLLNLPEEEMAVLSIARLLRFGAKAEDVEPVDAEGSEDITPPEEDITIDNETDVEV